MPDKSPGTDQVKGLFAELSDVNVRELCIGGLRSWREKFTDRSQVDVRDIGWEVLRSLAISKRVTLLDPAAQKEAIHAHIAEPWLSGLSEFVVWFVRAGLAWPMGAPTNGFPYWLHLTKAGLRFLDATEEHPLRSGFMDRLVARCPGLPDEVGSLLTDARRCVDAGLMRPAIVLMGVAYEVAVERVAESLVKKGHLKLADLDNNAAKLLGKVRSQVNGVLPAKEHQFAADAGCDFADQLRRRRNDGAHTTPTYGFEDREEAEEFLISAGRYLPHIWRMY